MSIIAQKPNTVKWAIHKSQAEQTAKKLARCKSIDKARVARMLNCGETIEAYYCPSCGKTHIKSHKRCRDRLCPLCSWRLSIQRYEEMKETLESLKPTIEAKRLRAAMLTLTIRNVKMADLREALTSISKAWKRLQQSRSFRAVYGWARCTEITYNTKTKTAHPHMHILLLWNDPEIRIPKMMGDLRTAWKEAARLDYVPVVDLREAYSKDGEAEAIACAGEAFAYSIKPLTISQMSPQHLEQFANAIRGFRFVSYGGAIKAARMKLGYTTEDQEDEKPVNQVCECGTPFEHMVLAWAAGGYQNIEREEKTA